MFPYSLGLDHRVDRDLHTILEHRRPLRRSAPERLQWSSPAEPFTRFDPPAVPPRPAATLYDLARDPRFARGAVAITPRRGLRVRLGLLLLWLGRILVRLRRT